MSKEKISFIILIVVFAISVGVTVYFSDSLWDEENSENLGVDKIEVMDYNTQEQGVIADVVTEPIPEYKISEEVSNEGEGRIEVSEVSGGGDSKQNVSKIELDGVSRGADPVYVDTSSSEVVSVDRKKITAYSRYDSNPIMANGQEVFEGAVASNDYPLGTRIRIEGTEYIVCDRMGVNGVVDIYMESPEAVRQWGVRYRDVEVLR